MCLLPVFMHNTCIKLLTCIHCRYRFISATSYEKEISDILLLK